MAKRVAKETSTPLIVALVFFVLTTIAFGVMWYMQFSDQQAKDDAVKKAQTEATAAKGEAADANMKASIYRTFIGIPEEKDIETIKAETKGQAKVSAEIKKVNEAMAKAAGAEDVSRLPNELRIWTLDEKGLPGDPPTKGIIPAIGDALAKRDAAVAAAATDRAGVASIIAAGKAAVAEYEKATKDFQDLAKSEPRKFAEKLKEEIAKFEKRTETYNNREASSQKELTELTDEKAKVERQRDNLTKEKVALTEAIKIAQGKAQAREDVFTFDEPQGKVLRRLPDGIVEINLGSNALVRPGLTFSVLPYDFPEKGRQSRVFTLREPNERGEYKNVQRFIEKADIEVIEVLGPNISRARITKEYDPIRDGASTGDLLYNAAWRKGTADHIALVGIFDINGDGTDDIETVVRDLTKMGIPVDAYFDMRKRQWVGQVTEQTRYIVEGYRPLTSAGDPNLEDKTKLLGAWETAVNAAKNKGAQVVRFSDFFPRMGYRMKIDVPADKINQAVAPYLNRAPGSEIIPSPPPGP
jgi:hypothetical protein